jgi:hypothetical protein
LARASPPPLGGPRPPAGSYGPQAGLRPGPQAALPARHPPRGPLAPSIPGPASGAELDPRPSAIAGASARSKRLRVPASGHADLARKRAPPLRGRYDPDKSRPAGKAGRPLSRARVRAALNQPATGEGPQYSYQEGGLPSPLQQLAAGFKDLAKPLTWVDRGGGARPRCPRPRGARVCQSGCGRPGALRCPRDRGGGGGGGGAEELPATGGWAVFRVRENQPVSATSRPRICKVGLNIALFQLY